MTQNRKFSHFGWKILAAGYTATFVTILVLAYKGQLPSYLAEYDKAGHVVLYCLATYLGHRVLNYRHIKIQTYTLALFPLLFTTFTLVEEGIQTLSPNRTLDAIDLIASFLGILLGWWLAERSR